MVIIRCDIVKGKNSNNLVRPAFDAAPRNQEGYVLDLGNIGKLEIWLIYIIINIKQFYFKENNFIETRFVIVICLFC